MTARALMFMGTGSDVGKSLVVAGLCRLFSNRGIRVTPFKPQNMSNNAAAVTGGGEIGRAQALQALAARIPASVHMNPVLLKPESETGAQVIIRGRREATLSARAYFAQRQRFLPAILHSFHQLAANHELILVEGAGSPAETNLRNGDLANLGFASAADIPCVLIGDIHRGGVIASLVGTHATLPQSDRELIKSFVINKFHGDPELFSEGSATVEKLTGWPCLGIVPHFPLAHCLPAEDAVALDHTLKGSGKREGQMKVCVFRLPRIANFDDLDPLRLEPSLHLTFVQSGEPLPGDCTLAIIPGSKSTIADLAHFREQGWDIDLKAHLRRGGHVLGLCGGYQMLGKDIHDPEGLEGQKGSIPGLGLLDVTTTLLPDKTVRPTQATHIASGTNIDAYEIHLGVTVGPDTSRPFAQRNDGPDGAVSRNGRVIGTYLHGCFSSDVFRRAYLSQLGAVATGPAYDETIDKTLDALARHLEDHLDVQQLLSLASPVGAM
jgi:adenosylcobyric acid synthase